MMLAPVITIDGPSGSGKGTLAQLLANTLKWHFLDSGALYRAFAWAVLHYKIDANDHTALEKLIQRIYIHTKADTTILVDERDVTHEIRSEACGQMASIISAIPLVRAALLDRQRETRQPPGLVTDGRDMGTVVFPDAILKFYLTASSEERTKRRYHQLKQKGKHVSLRDVLTELQVRDARDANRAISPTKPADDVILIDSTDLSIDQTLQLMLQHVQEKVL